MDNKICTYKDGITYLNIRVTPKASQNKIIGIREDALLVSVTAVPEKGLANESVIKILSKEFKIAKSKIQISTGSKGRNKIVCIEDDDNIQQLIKKYR